MERGYRRRVIEAAFEKVKQLERATTLSRVVREKKEDRVKAIFKFDKRLPDISGIMKRNYEVMVADDKRLKNVFGAPPMVCYSRGRNNRELLCRAKLPVSRGTMVTRQASSHSCPSIKRCFQKSMDTQFIIIVEKDTMVYIIYPKCDDAVVHQIAERYYGIHNIPKSQLCYIITKFPNILPRYLKENS